MLAQSNSQTTVENKGTRLIPDKDKVTAPKQELDKHPSELKTDSKNRQYLLIENRKVLTDQQGVQRLVNPVHLDSTSSKMNLPVEKAE